MSQPPPEDPFARLDPEVLELLAAQGIGAPDEPTPSTPGPQQQPPPPAPARSRGRAAASGAAIAQAVLLVAAAAADPSMLAAPIAWTGAAPVAPWAWSQYVLLGPLAVLLVWWWTGRLLAAASPAAPRRWVLSRTWLVVLLAMMAAKLAYSVVWMAPALAGGSADGLPLASSAAYLVWSCGFAGVKALLVGWLPATVAAVLWRPGRARRSPATTAAAQPTLSLLPAACVVLGLALVGTWTAQHWWTGSPMGYAHTSGWRLLAPTVASGRPGEIAALVVLWALLAGSMRVTLARVPAPRPASARLLAGALAGPAAGLGLAVVQSLVALVAGTDVPGGGDLWILPSTYLRVLEGLSFGLLVAPAAALATWLLTGLARPGWSTVASVAAVAVTVGAVVVVWRGTARYDGVAPLAPPDAPPVAMPPAAEDSAGPLPAPARITVRRDRDGSSVLADQTGAQVILRGVNVNQLGEYYAANPQVPTVQPLSEQDFADIAAMGFNAVRLVMSWSRLEPEPDRISEEYLDRVAEALRWARLHGIHVVLDVHQDAWSMGVVAPPGTTCRPATSPMTGWDGAPAWASSFDGAPPCQFTGRDLAPNVLRAFTSLYTDRDDIEAHLVEVWRRLAREFGGDATVAGYDLLNEPSFAEQAPMTSGMLLGRYHARAIRAIREGEAQAPAGYAHPVFLEPSIWWSGFGVDPLPPHGFTHDPQVVFSPHLYNESITMDQSLGVTLVGIERGYALAVRAAGDWGVPLWSGEWGSFSDPVTNRERYARFVAAEDSLRVGSAVWVWKQACGDPHVYPGAEAGNIRRVSCPSGQPLPSNAVELEPLTRAYPRTAPGRILAIRSDGRRLQVDGDTSGAGPVAGTPEPCTLDVWVPGQERPTLGATTAVTGLRVVEVPAGSAPQAPSGGWRVLGCAAGPYRLTLS